MPPKRRPGKGLSVTLLVMGVLLIAAGAAFAVLDARLISQTDLDAAALHTAITGVKEAFRNAAGQLAASGDVADAQAAADKLFEQNLSAVLAPLSSLEQAVVRGALFVLPAVRYRWVLLGAGFTLLGVGLMRLARRRHNAGQRSHSAEESLPTSEDTAGRLPPVLTETSARPNPAQQAAGRAANTVTSDTGELRVAPTVCPTCGAALRPGARFCNVCGEPANGEAPSGSAWRT